ncbi:unnamed protein product [Sphagnum balticum]
MDVVPERFLEDKLLVTGWLLQKLKLEPLLDFDFNNYRCERFLQFIRQSPGINPLYEEDAYLLRRSATFTKFELKGNLWSSLHIVGASGFVLLVTAAALLNDRGEAPVGWITGACFFLFCCFGYLTGNYLHVIRPLRCWIILWNPFCRDPDFMAHLREAAVQYAVRGGALSEAPRTTLPTAYSSGHLSSALTASAVSAPKGRRVRKKKDAAAAVQSFSSSEDLRNTASPHHVSSFEASEADAALDNFALRLARRRPRLYLAVVGHLLVMSELVALLTPVVAMGMQWVTALCDGPPLPAIVELAWLLLSCLGGTCPSSTSEHQHCILRFK